MKTIICSFFGTMLMVLATTARAQPAGQRFIAWYPGDEEIMVDASGAGWQECMGRGCSQPYTRMKGSLIKPGVFKAGNGYHYCKYPTEATKNHSQGRCSSSGWHF